MAFNDVVVSPDKVETVMAVTGFGDQAIILNALKGNQANVDTVVNEYLDAPDKVCPRFLGFRRLLAQLHGH